MVVNYIAIHIDLLGLCTYCKSSIFPDKMTVHALHIFDRKGKTLFTKSYTTSKQQLMQDAEQLSEQRKLIFGMLFSLRELVGSLTPDGDSQGTTYNVWYT